MKNTVIIIPARYKSSRLAGKPLKIINGKALIYWTWKNCSRVIDKSNIYVATESKKIKKFCKINNINCILTSSKCKTGTDRVSEVIHLFKKKNIINVQGDEPLIKKKDIKKFISFFKKNKKYVVNAYTAIKSRDDYFNTKVPKIIINKKNELMYISRSPIPGSKKYKFNQSFKQVCIYGFPSKILKKYFGLKKKKTALEKIEDIEILRFIENGEKVKMIKLKDNILSIDTKNDLIKAKKLKLLFNNNL